jgi:serine phosphatase RsbU (regulator of sigma subunit)
MTILDGMFFAVQEALRQGQRFTGWTIGNELANPLFSVNGNSVSPAMIFRWLLLLAIVVAVYLSYREERQREVLLANEFSNARTLQRMLIPEHQISTPGFSISSSYRPALEVGGDFFQFIPSEGDPNGTTLLLLGDVSGHGLKAALTVSYVIGVMRVLAEFFPEPGPLLTEMNRRLCGRMDNGFATCIAVKINRFGACTLSSAGHPPPFLNWNALEVPGAVPLGLDLSARYDQTTLQFNPGDHLALYTDGLLEARKKSGELYGFERLQKLFAANPSAPEAAEEAVRFGQDDDITVVTLAFTGVREETTEAAAIRTIARR